MHVAVPMCDVEAVCLCVREVEVQVHVGAEV